MLTVILTNPQMGENIGAAARAMLNFGLKDLRIVNPRDGWPNERADATASGAFDMMQVSVFDNLSDAIADLHFCFATTARDRDMVKPVFTPENALIEIAQRQAQGQNVGLVFGAERTGLLNEEISQCQSILTFPVNPESPSLNLAQAVLLMAYELGKDTDTQTLCENEILPAPQKEITAFLARLQADLEARKFFRSEHLKPTMVKNISNIFTRADITEQELRTLHGILSALRGNKTQE